MRSKPDVKTTKQDNTVLHVDEDDDDEDLFAETKPKVCFCSLHSLCY